MRELSVFQLTAQRKAKEEGRIREIQAVKAFLKTNPTAINRTISAKNHRHNGNNTVEVTIVRIPSGIETELKLVKYTVTDVSNKIGAESVIQDAECGYAHFTGIYNI